MRNYFASQPSSDADDKAKDFVSYGASGDPGNKEGEDAGGCGKRHEEAQVTGFMAGGRDAHNVGGMLKRLFCKAAIRWQ